MTQAERVREAARSRVKALESLNRLDWTDLDVGAAEDSRRHQQQRLDALRAASTADLRLAEKAQDEAWERLDATKKHETAKRTVVADHRSQVNELASVIESLTAEDPAIVSGPDADALDQRFHSIRRSITHSEIDGVALQVSGMLTEEENAARDAARTAERFILSVESSCISAWPAAAGDLSAEISDRGAFLEILAKLRADRLPLLGKDPAADCRSVDILWLRAAVC
jgi:uncharacterized protein YPO0396